MADKTITQLTATTSSASSDEIPLWVAGSAVTRKITKANFLQGAFTGGGTVATGGFTLTVPATGTAALRGADNAFSAVQTMVAGINIGVAASQLYRPTPGVVRQTLDTNSITNLGALTVSTGVAGRGLVYVYNATAGGGALFLVNGAAGTLVAGSAAAFTGTSGNAGTLNVYATGGNILIENRTGSTITVACWVLL